MFLFENTYIGLLVLKTNSIGWQLKCLY